MQAASVAVAKPARIQTLSVPSDGVLHVDVAPNLKRKGYWKVRVERKSGSKWRHVATRRTVGRDETLDLRIKQGTYRVRVLRRAGSPVPKASVTGPWFAEQVPTASPQSAVRPVDIQTGTSTGAAGAQAGIPETGHRTHPDSHIHVSSRGVPECGDHWCPGRYLVERVHRSVADHHRRHRDREQADHDPAGPHRQRP